MLCALLCKLVLPLYGPLVIFLNDLMITAVYNGINGIMQVRGPVLFPSF